MRWYYKALEYKQMHEMAVKREQHLERILKDRTDRKSKTYPRQAIADAERNSTSQLYLDAMGVALEICCDHGLATGHGDTLADILREINGQLKKREKREK
jgi:hypothetical protein